MSADQFAEEIELMRADRGPQDYHIPTMDRAQAYFLHGWLIGAGWRLLPPDPSTPTRSSEFDVQGTGDEHGWYYIAHGLGPHVTAVGVDREGNPLDLLHMERLDAHVLRVRSGAYVPDEEHGLTWLPNGELARVYVHQVSR